MPKYKQNHREDFQTKVSILLYLSNYRPYLFTKNYEIELPKLREPSYLIKVFWTSIIFCLKKLSYTVNLLSFTNSRVLKMDWSQTT